MTMATARYPALLALVLLPLACGEGDRAPAAAVDCSVADPYEFGNISDFASGDSGWFLYADNTPRAIPDPLAASNVAITQVPPPGRCGDTGMVQLKSQGHNVYGAGFGDWTHNAEVNRANGTGYEGISFWARSARATDKTFMLYVDDGRTIVLPPPATEAGLPPLATSADQDLDGDGYVGPGDIARGTRCRLPPDQSLGNPACYYGGELPPATPTRVPAADECGNQFHTYVSTRDDWQLFLIPWAELVQWPCPNRLRGGIDPADIAKLEIKMLQGTSYDIWLDNIAFYRRRADAGG
jgi:hypothetical protein